MQFAEKRDPQKGKGVRRGSTKSLKLCSPEEVRALPELQMTISQKSKKRKKKKSWVLPEICI